MSSTPLRQIFASTSFRLALICAAVILLAFSAAGLAAWFVTKSAAEQASRQQIHSEMEALRAELRDEGPAALIAAVEARQQSAGGLEYRLVDRDGRVLAGNLPVEAAPGWSVIYFPDAPGRSGPDLIVLNQPFEGFGALTIAQDLEQTEWVRYAMLRTLFSIGAVALVIALVAGYLAARRALRAMDDLVAAMAEVGGGNLSVRVLETRPAEGDVAILRRGVNAMLERIDALVAHFRRVSNDVAHELRTPLSHARQQLDDVMAAPSLDAAKSAAAAAQGRIDDLMRTFAAILRLGEIDAGAARARFAPVDLGALAERVGDAYRPDIEASGRSLAIEAAHGAVIVGDADMLAQALANLLDNAIAHTHAGTAISVRVGADGRGPALSVADTGPGIEPGDRERVLRPFERLDANRTTPGAGLGLSIVNAIARLHGAELRIADAQPGLLVSMEWPIESRASARSEPAVREQVGA